MQAIYAYQNSKHKHDYENSIQNVYELLKVEYTDMNNREKYGFPETRNPGKANITHPTKKSTKNASVQR